MLKHALSFAASASVMPACVAGIHGIGGNSIYAMDGRDTPGRDARISRRRAQAGFTLLEILIVVVIVGLLTALIGPNLLSRLDTAKVQTTETQVRQLKSALDVMRLDISRYPTFDEGLNLLVNPPTDSTVKDHWHGPYLDGGVVPKDPWGNPYQYTPTTNPARPFALYSLGPSGKLGGTGDNASIGMLP